MRIPKSIKVKRSKWSVLIDSGSEKFDTSKYRGLCYPDSREIFISVDQPRNEMEETFVHELLHACWPGGACGDKLEEEIVVRLSKTLYKALKENKMLNIGNGRRKEPKQANKKHKSV